MLPRRIANRYAQALFDLAQERGTTEQWERELATLASVIEATADLRAILTHPEIPLQQKETVITRAFQGKIAQEVLAVLLLLIRRGHEPDMGTLDTVYKELWDKARRVLPVTVTSAVPLTDVQAAALTQMLTLRTGARIQLTRTVDPELLAGMVVTMGDRVIDASARTTLTALRSTMIG